MSHFKDKILHIQFPASVRSFVCLLDGVWHLIGYESVAVQAYFDDLLYAFIYIYL